MKRVRRERGVRERARKTTDEKPPGLDEVESEPKTQDGKNPSQMESEQEALAGTGRDMCLSSSLPLMRNVWTCLLRR